MKNLGYQIVMIFVVTLLLSSFLADMFLTEIINKPKSNTSESSTLEVRPAVDSKAVPLDFNLQGSSPDEQKAVGELQQPATQDLQPNAREGIFSEGF